MFCVDAERVRKIEDALLLYLANSDKYMKSIVQSLEEITKNTGVLKGWNRGNIPCKKGSYLITLVDGTVSIARLGEVNGDLFWIGVPEDDIIAWMEPPEGYSGENKIG